MKLQPVFFASTFIAAGQLSGSVITYAAQLISDTTPAGVGSALITIDPVANTLSVVEVFSFDSGTAIASEIHCCTPSPGTAGAATPTFGNSGAMSGFYTSPVLDMTLASTWDPAFVTAEGSVANAEAALIAGLAAGEAYDEIHNSTGLPIRGFLTLTPEPATLGLVGAALAGLFLTRRRRSHA